MDNRTNVNAALALVGGSILMGLDGKNYVVRSTRSVTDLLDGGPGAARPFVGDCPPPGSFTPVTLRFKTKINGDRKRTDFSAKFRDSGFIASSWRAHKAKSCVESELRRLQAPSGAAPPATPALAAKESDDDDEMYLGKRVYGSRDISLDDSDDDFGDSSGDDNDDVNADDKAGGRPAKRAKVMIAFMEASKVAQESFQLAMKDAFEDALATLLGDDCGADDAAGACDVDEYDLSDPFIDDSCESDLED